MRRVAIVGTSGSGKSTLRRQLAARLAVPELELDAVHHLPDWEPIDPGVFREQVGTFVEGHDGWVVDGNYRAVRDLVWGAADTVVWLDLPRGVVMWRVTTRSFARLARREELWHGNRESLRNLLSWDPERSIIRWAWTTHADRRDEYGAALADPRWQPLTAHRLRTRRDVTRFLEDVTPAGASST